MAQNSTLVLIDGHALAYRAFYALPPEMATSSGELTNATFGFTSMLLNVLQEERPEYVAVTFDKGLTFRHDMYEGYKATRAKMPDELRPQLDRIREVVATLDMPIFEQEGFEADDLLGTLSVQASDLGVNTLIVTGDMDILQLVGPRVRVLTSRWRFSDTATYDVDAVRERYGIEPSQLVDLKAMMGDKSDNIPGVAGVGEKTAAKLLRQYGTLDSIYEHLDEVQTRFRNKLRDGREQAYLSQRLARIDRAAPVTLDLEACAVQSYDYDQVVTLFRELEFRSLMERLPAAPGSPPPGASFQLGLFDEAGAARPGAETDYIVVDSEEGLHQMVEDLGAAEALTFDTETTHTDPMVAEMVGIALSSAPGKAYYVPVAGPDGDAHLPPGLVYDAIGPLLRDTNLLKCAHNAKYDLAMMELEGIEVHGLAFDTMLAEWLINPSSKNLGLKNLAWARLGQQMAPITDLIGTGRNQITMRQVPIAQAAPYACADADMTHRLVSILEPELKEKELWSLFTEVEMPLVPVLFEIERTGVLLDVEMLTAMSDDLRARLGELTDQIYQMVGYSFNINSTQQLSDALFKSLALPTQGLRRTKSGHFSTAAAVLRRLRAAHPVIGLILEQRELTKLKSTYVDSLPRLVNPNTGRIHTSYNQTGAVTGRISSSDPNLQNIPVRTPLGKRVRGAFVAAPGSKLVAADYSQVELRVMAHVSEDPGLLNAFARGEDIHSSTAAAILNVPLEQVTSDQRRLAKAVNFGLSYGQTAFGLAQATGKTQPEAENFIRAYFERFPNVRAYIDQTKALATRQGYVETLLGRRRYFPELQPGSRAVHNVRQSAERMAVNAPIQGTAADIIKIAMIRLQEELRERRMQSNMILQVHDELILESPNDEVGEAADLAREVMENAFELKAALKVDLSVGQNWHDLEPM